MEWRLCVDQASLGNWCGCEVEGFEMSSVRLLGRMLFCFGWREWDFRGIVLRSVAGTGFGVQFFWWNSLRVLCQLIHNKVYILDILSKRSEYI